MIHVIILFAMAARVFGVCFDDLNLCSGGCWRNENMDCVPAGAGYFSPHANDSRFLCPMGTFSTEAVAAKCQPCSAGSISGSLGATFCIECPPRFYQDQPGQTTCASCVPGYNGNGANAVEIEPSTDSRICRLRPTTTAPSMAPIDASALLFSHFPSQAPVKTSPLSVDRSLVPTEEMTLSPSSLPTRLLDSTVAPTPFVKGLFDRFRDNDDHTDSSTMIPSASPSTMYISFSATTCDDNSYVRSGGCGQCPSELQFMITALVYLSVTVLLGTLICFGGAGSVMMMLNFFQLLAFLGRTGFDWPSHVGMVLSFTSDALFDLTGLFQCQFGWTVQGSRTFLLCLPFILGIPHQWVIPILHGIGVLSARSSIKVEEFIRPWYVFGVIVAFPSLLVTAVEAFHCDGLGHICIYGTRWETVQAVVNTILGISWLAVVPFSIKHFHDTHSDDFHATIVFRGYEEWWWHRMVLGRHAIMVFVISVLEHEWRELGLILALTANLILQPIVAPYKRIALPRYNSSETNDDDGSNDVPRLQYSLLFGNQAADLVAQSISLTALIAARTARSAKTVTIVGSFLYVSMAHQIIVLIVHVVVDRFMLQDHSEHHRRPEASQQSLFDDPNEMSNASDEPKLPTETTTSSDQDPDDLESGQGVSTCASTEDDGEEGPDLNQWINNFIENERQQIDDAKSKVEQ